MKGKTVFKLRGGVTIIRYTILHASICPSILDEVNRLNMQKPNKDRHIDL